MGIYISYGKYNKNYKFVILTGIFMILKYHLPSILTEIFLKYGKINEYTKTYLFNHDHIIDNFRFFCMLVFSFIFYIYEKKSSKSISNVSNTENASSSNSQKGCFEVIKNNDERKNNVNKKKISLNLNILIVITICLINESLADIISFLSIFSFWTIILLTISYINTKMFKRETYKHQKLAIYFSFVTSFLFQLTSFILTMTSKESNQENIYKDPYLNLWYLPLGLIIHFVYVCISSYTYSKIKWFMDLKQISLTKLFMIYSILGFFINIIFCVIITYIKCRGKVAKFFCTISDNEDDLYLDNIFVFFDDISNIYEEKKNYLIYIIFIIFVDMICDSLFIFFFFQF